MEAILRETRQILSVVNDIGRNLKKILSSQADVINSISAIDKRLSKLEQSIEHLKKSK